HFKWIESWARIPGKPHAEVLENGFFHWFVPWFGTYRSSREFVVLSAAVALFLFRIAVPARRPALVRAPAEWAAIACGALSLAQWFHAAPDLRFGAVFLWVWLAALLAPQIAVALREMPGRIVALALSFVLVSWAGGLELRLSAEPRWWNTP